MSNLASYLKGKEEPMGMQFRRGNIARAKRDVLARRLEKKKGIKTPYALSTWMIKHGADVKESKPGDKMTVSEELEEQTTMAKKKGK